MSLLPDEGRRGNARGGEGNAVRPALHAVASYLKTFQALPYEGLQESERICFGLRLLDIVGAMTIS